jgi:carboxyl-terminal processing protease
VFIDFARYYLSRHDTIARDFEVDGRVMVDFRAFLDGDHVPYTEAELRQDEETLKRGIKQNLFMAVFGKNEGDRISITHDPVVLKAVEVIPQAGQLAQNAHRLIAQRGATE